MTTNPVEWSRVRALVFSATLFLGFGTSLAGQETPPEVASPPTAAEKNQAELLRAFLQIKEDLHATQLAVVNARLEAEAAARMQTAALTEKIEAMRMAFETERERQRLEWEHKEAERAWQRAEAEEFNRLVLWIGGVFGAVGLLAVLATPLLQWRALNRFVRENGDRLQLAGGPGRAELALPASVAAADHVVAASNQRLLSAVERMERRIAELENTSGASALEDGVSPADQNAQRIMAAQAMATTREEIPFESAVVRATGENRGDDTRLLLEKGRLLLELNRAGDAIACYDEILRGEPSHAEALMRKGSALEQLRRDEEALACYDAAIRADRKKTLAYLYKGAVCNRLERYAESVESYEQALKVEKAGA